MKQYVIYIPPKIQTFSNKHKKSTSTLDKNGVFATFVKCGMSKFAIFLLRPTKKLSFCI